jgi:hypothetical protein
MKTIRTVEIIPVFCEGDIPQIPSSYEENKFYVASDQRKIGLKCLCGCGDLIILPVNIGPEGWGLKVDELNRITLIGSIKQLQG